MSRFYFQGQSAADKLLAGAHKLEITIQKIGTRLIGEYTMTGTIGNPFYDDEDDDDEILPRPQADVFGFVSGVLSEYERAQKGGGQ